MEYHFSVTPRMMLIFLFCCIIFVLSIFFLGEEIGKTYAVFSIRKEASGKISEENQINNLKSEVDNAKKLIDKTVQSADKKTN